MQPNPESVKGQSNHHCLFALFGAAGVKTTHKTLVKLTPGLNLITPLGAYLGA